MRGSIIPIAALLLAAPLEAQIVGRTCGPKGCNPVFAARPPEARPLIDSIYGACGQLIVNVYLLNDEYVPVPIDSQLSDLSLRSNGRTLRPELRRDPSLKMIAPGAFIGPIRYSGTVPRDLSGLWTFNLGYLPPVELSFDAVENCPPSIQP